MGGTPQQEQREADKMAIKAILDSLEGVEEALHSIYTEKNGKFVLEVEGMQHDADVNGLKTALVKERENAAAYKKLGSPDDINAKFAELEAKASKGGKASEEQQQIIDQMKAGYEQKLADQQAMITQTYTRQATSDLKAELAKAGVVPEGLDLLAGFAASRIKFNDDGTPKVMSSDGSMPMIGSGSNGGATLTDLAKELAGSIPHLVADKAPGGGGKQPNDKGGKPTSKTVTRAQWDVMPTIDRSNHVKEGGTVVDG